MRLLNTVKDAAGELHYGPGTLRRVAALASQLQSRQTETLTVRDMQAIGAEAGLEPAFIRHALAQLAAHESAAHARSAAMQAHWSRAGATSWWAAGWTLPFILVLLTEAAGMAGAIAAIAFFAGWAMYLAAGIMLSAVSREPVSRVPASFSRTALLEMLVLLQRELEDQKEHRAFLSVDVVDSTEMKRSAPELAAEYSFRWFGLWVEEIVHAHGGQMQSAAGDGMMCLFETDTEALRAARQLQEELPRFNQTHNRLPAAFRVRCGVSAGDVPIETDLPLGRMQSPIIDRAAGLQKRAQPGEILVSGEMAATALMELGALAPAMEPIAGAPALSWRAGHPAALPIERGG